MDAKNDNTNYKFFSHRECEYFPCHKGADPERFNCLFCYCPLYLLGEKSIEDTMADFIAQRDTILAKYE